MNIEDKARELADELEQKQELQAIENQANEIVTAETNDIGANGVIGNVKQDILVGARKKIDNEKTKEKHSKKLASVADKAIDTEIEMESIKVERQKAQNKADKQEIKNKIYVLKQEHAREIKEQRQLNATQRMEHRKTNKEKKWETYGKSLEQLGYDYVPNPVVLAICMFLVGTKAFFNGLSKTGDAMIKALKWIFLVGGILLVLMIIPVTRQWLFEILGFIPKVKP